MKLHDPGLEKDLIRLALEGRRGKEMVRSDRRPLRRITSWFGPIVFGAMMFGFLCQVLERGLLQETWRLVIACAAIMLLSFAGSLRITGAVTDGRIYQPLIHLPIGGAHALRWIRSRRIWWDGLWVLLVCFMVGTAMSDGVGTFPWLFWPKVLVLWLIVVSTTHLLDHPWLERSGLAGVWLWMSAGTLALMVAAKVLRLHGFLLAGGSADWLLKGVDAMTWIFPPSWVLGGRFESGGWLLALPWTVAGVHRAFTWPERMRHVFDGPLDSWEENEGDEDDTEGCGDWNIHGIEAHRPEAGTENDSSSALLLPGRMVVGGPGWVDQWVRLVLGKHQSLAAILLPPGTSWTRRTHFIMIAAPVWLGVSWLYLRHVPETDWKGFGGFFGWVVAAAVPLLVLLPFTNAIPRATGALFMGMQAAPVLSFLPITTRDLLSVSMRITLARCTVMVVILSILVWLQCMVFMPGGSPWPAIGLVPATGIFWSACRPVFVWYRLQSHCRPRKGAWLAHAAVVAACVVLALTILPAGATGFFLAFSSGLEDAPAPDRWRAALMASGCFGLVAACARAVFELFHWEVRSGRLDWSSPPE